MIYLPANIDQLSRKERERFIKRGEILHAATQLFAEKGFMNTTIDDIAEKAEFGKGTIYNYFSSKEEMFSVILEEISISYLETVVKLDNRNQSFYDFVYSLSENLFDFCVNQKYAFKIIARIRTNTSTFTSNIPKKMIENHAEIDRILIKRIDKAVKAKEIEKVDSHSLIALYRSMIFPYIFNKMFCGTEKEINVAEETKFIVNILFNGIKK